MNQGKDSKSKLRGFISEILTESNVVDLSTGNEIEQSVTSILVNTNESVMDTDMYRCIGTSLV